MKLLSSFLFVFYFLFFSQKILLAQDPPPYEGWVLTYNQNNFAWADVPFGLDNKLKALDARKRAYLHGCAVNRFNDWVAFYHSGAENGPKSYNASWDGPPRDLMAKIADYNGSETYINDIAFTPEGGWVIIYENHSAFWKSLPANLVQTILKLHEQEINILSINFGSDGAWVLVTEKKIHYEAIPSDLERLIGDLEQQGAQFIDAAFTRNGEGWIVLYDENKAKWKLIPEKLAKTLIRFNEEGYTLQSIDL